MSFKTERKNAFVKKTPRFKAPLHFSKTKRAALLRAVRKNLLFFIFFAYNKSIQNAYRI